tara:strand:+ start:380 stop:1411 length:1032 start_codon:yes stop_codon:yes gene_type:complete
MATPNISGILNNCALDCAIPSVMRFVETAAQKELAGELANISMIHALSQYEQLKKMFAEYYNLPLERFGWQAFHQAIQATPSFLEQQLIFTPVIRQFVAHQMQRQGKEQHEIDKLTTIQDNGRYFPLYDKEASDFFYKPLAINTTFHYQEDFIPDESFSVDNPLDEIDIYHQNAHFELAQENHGLVNPFVATLSPKFATAFEQFNSLDNTTNQLEILQAEINSRFLTALESDSSLTFHEIDDTPSSAQEPELSAHQLSVIESLVDAQTHHTTTQSNQAFKALYRENLNQLIAKYNDGFFDDVDDKIDVRHMDDAKANQDESDEDFAKRLQEAALRGANIKPSF